MSWNVQKARSSQKVLMYLIDFMLCLYATPIKFLSFKLVKQNVLHLINFNPPQQRHMHAVKMPPSPVSVFLHDVEWHVTPEFQNKLRIA